MEENMIVIRNLKTFYFNFDLPKDVNKNLKYEIEFIITINESLAENKIKNKIEQLLLQSKHKTIFMNMENSKENEPHKFVPNLLERLDLRSSDKHVVLQNLCICNRWKNIIKQHKTIKQK